MVEVLLEPCGQEVAVADNACKLETPTESSPQDSYRAITQEMKLTPIQEFYNGQSVFITGGTGFMGKLLIEKLLRGCPGIASLYLLVRSKKGKDVHQRIEELFDDPVFSVLKEQQPKFRHQIVAISGDCSLPGLGMTDADRETVLREVSIVFHAAATVRFDEKMNLAVPINVRSLKDIIGICREMSDLKSFVYVSTAYANCPCKSIEERFYDPPMDADKLIALLDCMDEKLIDEITPRLLGRWPNTYTFTKAVAESVLKNYATDLPTGVFRPAIVISTYMEPIQGWIDNLYGPTGVAAGAGIGLLRSIHCDGSKNVNIVPGDLTINALIASAWDIANIQSAKIEEKKEEKHGKTEVPIYNYVSKDNPLTYDELKNLSEKYGLEFPSCKAIWYYSFRNNKNRVIHLLCVYFLHLLPALLFDIAAFCMGKQPRLLKIYKKIHKFMDVLNYFSVNEWTFSNETTIALMGKLTTEDRKTFPCDIRELNWDFYFRSYLRGIRVYLIKDPIETLPQARVKWQRLYWLHQATKFILAYVILRLCWAVFSSLQSLRHL